MYFVPNYLHLFLYSTVFHLFQYLGITLIKQNSLQEEIKSRLKSQNAYYQSVQNLLSFTLLTKKISITIHRTITLPIVLYGHNLVVHIEG